MTSQGYISTSPSQLLCESEPRLTFRVALSVRLLRLSYGAGGHATFFQRRPCERHRIRVSELGCLLLSEAPLRQRENRRRGRLGTVHLRSRGSTDTGASLSPSCVQRVSKASGGTSHTKRIQSSIQSCIQGSTARLLHVTCSRLFFEGAKFERRLRSQVDKLLAPCEHCNIHSI